MLQINETKLNNFLKLSSLVKNLSQSVNCHDHSKAFTLPIGKETAKSLLRQILPESVLGKTVYF